MAIGADVEPAAAETGHCSTAFVHAGLDSPDDIRALAERAADVDVLVNDADGFSGSAAPPTGRERETIAFLASQRPLPQRRRHPAGAGASPSDNEGQGLRADTMSYRRFVAVVLVALAVVLAGAPGRASATASEATRPSSVRAEPRQVLDGLDLEIDGRAYVAIPTDVFWPAWGAIFVACVLWIGYVWHAR